MLGLSLAASAAAQETRTEEIATRQREKAAKSAPYQPGAVEKFMIRLEENFTSPPNGFYPEFGSIYRGGGFTFGAGYRHFFAREAMWNVKALYSIKNYKQVETGVLFPWNGAGRWTFDARGGWLDAPSVSYYEIGRAHV